MVYRGARTLTVTLNGNDSPTLRAVLDGPPEFYQPEPPGHRACQRSELQKVPSASTWTVVVAGPAPASDTVFLYGVP